MIKLIETELIEKERDRLNSIPVRFRTEKELGKIEVYEKVFSILQPYQIFEKKVFKKEPEQIEKAKKILDICIKELKTPLECLAVKTRRRNLVEKRQLIMYATREYSNCTLKTVGSYFGFHHATVLHNLNTIKNLIETDSTINETYYRIAKECEKL
jgi:chromosomal replication initiation ATPase DnaA